MRTPFFALVAAAAATAWMVPSPASAAESYDNCTGFIDSVPATISTQGTWCLRKDLSTGVNSGGAITIANNNITIDCNDFKLGGLAAGLGTSTIGIRALNKLNTTVRNCNVRGFLVGAQLNGASGGGHVVEDNRFDGNTYIGIDIQGDGSVVRKNMVLDTGGTTSNAAGLALGIHAAYAVDVLDNTVSGVLPSADAGGDGDAAGIYTASNPSGSISHNRVRGLIRVGAGVATGIQNVSSNRISVLGNQVVGNGETGSTGLLCASANGRAIDNIVNGFVTPISVCSNDGNVVP